MQPVKKPAAVLLIIAMFIFFACQKEEKIIPSNPDVPDVPTKIIIEAMVPSVIYSNKKEIKMDASTMKALNGDRSLTYLWSCTQFPKEKPSIEYPQSSSTRVFILDTGKYNFNLRVKDNFGNEASADYQLTVYQDTLTDPPVVPPMSAKEFTLPEPVYLISSDLVSVNPVNRELKYNWTVIEQPAGSPAIDIKASNSSHALAKDCIPGKYVFKLEVTNELNLKASNLLEVTIHADPLAGITKVYENLHWAIYDDGMGDVFLGLYVKEPQTSFFTRSKSNTEISLWDFTSQVWMAPNNSEWSGWDEGVIINNYTQLSGIADGTPAKVKITFK